MAEIHVDGLAVSEDDLTFREQRAMRELIRQIAPQNDLDQAGDADILPALICVIKQRTDPAFTIEQALDFRPSDLEAPPTRPKRTPAAAGAPKSS